MRIALIAFLTRVVTSLRYRITIEGAEKLRDLKGAALVLPNHPGYIDPVLVASRLAARFHLRPLVTTGMYRLPLLLPALRALSAIEVPSMEVHSSTAHGQVDEIIREVVAGLDRGEKFLIYPSGRIEQDGLEHIGSAWSVSDILTQRPMTTVVLLRTSGLWGSMGTMAVTGKSPNLRQTFWRSVRILLANLIFFTPRRRVTMTLEVVPPGSLPGTSRETLNPFLDAWYNRGLSPEPVFVPHHFLFGPRTFDYPKSRGGADLPLNQITAETKQGVREIVERKLKRSFPDEENAPNTSLDQLGLDSFDRMDVAQEVENRFGFRSEEVAATLGELWALAEGLSSSPAAKPIKIPARLEHRAKRRPVAAFVSGKSLLEALVRQALAHSREAAAADELSGVVTYERMLIGARLMENASQRCRGTRSGSCFPLPSRPILLSWRCSGRRNFLCC